MSCQVRNVAKLRSNLTRLQGVTEGAQQRYVTEVATQETSQRTNKIRRLFLDMTLFSDSAKQALLFFDLEVFSMNTVIRTAIFCHLLTGILFTPVYAGTCLNGSCHQDLTKTKHLHGPVAAEAFRTGGCVMCHTPSDKKCTTNKPGKFTLKMKEMCLACHAKGTGTQHSTKQGKCLSCHNPHGSNDSPYFLRKGK